MLNVDLIKVILRPTVEMLRIIAELNALDVPD
jgi:hypothetical protein